MDVKLIAHTDITPDAYDVLPARVVGYEFPSDADYLAEFAGRACYQSFHRPNPATLGNGAYLANVIGKGHESILEHATATFYITGVSRSLTHELIRHRHLSVSELSQRYVDVEDVEFVAPPALDNDNDRHWLSVSHIAKDTYRAIVDVLHGKRGLPRKQAREAARAVMPNCTETRIVVTGNMRAWRHVIRLRGSEHADAEIRELAINLLDQLYDLAPNTFYDFTNRTLPDGREVIE